MSDRHPRPLARFPRSTAPCTARVLHSQILERIEAADSDVYTSRARVPTWRRAGTAAQFMVAGPPAPHVVRDAPGIRKDGCPS